MQKSSCTLLLNLRPWNPIRATRVRSRQRSAVARVCAASTVERRKARIALHRPLLRLRLPRFYPYRDRTSPV
jgi:hypothetical protein